MWVCLTVDTCLSVSQVHVYKLWTVLLYIPPTALVPNQVENLAARLNPNVPSVTLTWDPPSNVGVGTRSSWPDVTKYHIRFKPKRGTRFETYCSTTSIVLNRDSGLMPLITSKFEVRAQCGDCIGKWKAVSEFIGKQQHQTAWHRQGSNCLPILNY